MSTAIIGGLKRCESGRHYVSISDLLSSVQDTLVCGEKWWLQSLDLQQLLSPWHRLKHTVRQLPQADEAFNQYVSSCEAVKSTHHCDITDSRPRQIRPPGCFAQILSHCTSPCSASFIISHVLTRARSLEIHRRGSVRWSCIFVKGVETRMSLRCLYAIIYKGSVSLGLSADVL